MRLVIKTKSRLYEAILVNELRRHTGVESITCDEGDVVVVLKNKGLEGYEDAVSILNMVRSMPVFCESLPDCDLSWY